MSKGRLPPDERQRGSGFLRVRFARVDETLGALKVDMLAVKQRLTTLGIQVGSLPATEQNHYGSVMQRLDRTETRLGRIERRLDIAEAPA